MPQKLPLFPLSLVVYPGEQLKLHIFEPRYRQLIRECLDKEITFGIPAVIEKKVATYATEVKLLRIEKKYGGGEMDITTEGQRRIKVLEFFREIHAKPYPGGDIEREEDIMDADLAVQENIFDRLKQLHQALGIRKSYPEGPAGIRAYDIAHHIGMNLEQEYELLTFTHESDRLALILAHLERILPVILETERLKAKAKLNGHYKNIIPPEF